ncbi:hypothetical protein FACS1894137_14230 [Spirochaetia bacterium]|nr:hypothetical protein FACS1894137_14230 [Spirochaetia bacterium]
MRKKINMVRVFIICMVIFVSGAAVCLLNLDLLKRPVFQKKTDFFVAASAKYARDGNLYIIDSGSFRLICMTAAGEIRYTININKMQEYTKFFDSIVDEAGNLYVYAMEAEYDAYRTKRDIIKKYDRNGKFIKDIFSVNYADDEDWPHIFPQYGSLRSEKGVLTFSRVMEDRVLLYCYDTYRDELTSSVFPEGVSGYSVSGYSVARLMLKDFENFIYTTRDGDIYEVKNGGPPLLRASFDFTDTEGGIIPWYPEYDSRGDIIFFDMVSSAIYRIDGNNKLWYALPSYFFDELRAGGAFSVLTGYGFFEERFAGVYDDIVWYYDGKEFKTYEDGITLSFRERCAIFAVQVSFVVGILFFGVGIYLLFKYILDGYISLLVKQIVFIIPITIAGIVVLYAIVFNLMISRINNEIFNELLLAATISAKLIDGDDVDHLSSIKDFKTDTYKRLAETLKVIVGDNRNDWNKLFYAAIYKVIEEEEYIIALSNDEMNMFRPYGSIAIVEGSSEYDLMTKGTPFADIAELPDGKWAYANVPLYNNAGKIVGIFEIGLDMTSHELTNMKQRRRIALVDAIICFIILLSLVAIMSSIVRELSSIVKVLQAIAGGNYSARVHYRAKDELGNVSRGLNHMTTELQDQFMKINSLNESTIRFVPVQFMEHLGVTDITKMKLGDNVQRNLTVLFFDIRFFSINSEMMTARENFIFINEVTGIAGPIIRKHNGFVDKYIGDAVMALFADAGDAVRAGIEIYRKLVVDKETQVKIGVDGINIGVGIHSGSVMMGIVGENERLSSTVISPNVNLASRMESLTKQTQSGMLITRDTLNQIPKVEGEFQYRFIGMIQAAGVNEVVGAFDVLDALPVAVRNRRLATKKVFESGIRKYHMKEYQTACKRFEMVVKADPADICAANCLEEAQRRLNDPTLPSVFIFNKK